MAQRIEVTVGKLEKALGAMRNEYYEESRGPEGSKSTVAKKATSALDELLEDRDMVGRLAAYLQIVFNE